MADPQAVAKGVDNAHVGLHKVLGTTVEAIVGGVYHQFVRPPFSSAHFSLLILSFVNL